MKEMLLKFAFKHAQMKEREDQKSSNVRMRLLALE